MVEADIFEATDEISVIIGCIDYSSVREIEGCHGFQDLPEVEENMKAAEKHLHVPNRDGKEANIVLKNVKKKQMFDLFKRLKKILLENSQAGKTTLVKFYYAGHGVMRELLELVVSEKKTPFKLEWMLLTLATTPNCAIIGIFDCCRNEPPASLVDPESLKKPTER